MFKYFLFIVLFSLFFLVPMKNMKEDIKYLEEGNLILELDIIQNEKDIDSLNREIVKYKKMIEINKENSLIIKKNKPKKTEIIEVKPIPVTQPEIQDTL